MKSAPDDLPQATLVIKDAAGKATQVISGNCPLTTAGLGITPGNQFGLVLATETPEESQLFAAWFTQLWDAPPTSAAAKDALLAQLGKLSAHREPSLIYALTLHSLFKDRGDELDIDDPAFESLPVGRMVKVLVQDVDLVCWKQDLTEDRNRLALLRCAPSRYRPRCQARNPEKGDREQNPPPGNRHYFLSPR